MSDRGDFFASGAAKDTKRPPSRADFFSGKVDADLETNNGGGVGIGAQPGIQMPDASVLEETAPGINRGVAQLLGMPVDFAGNMFEVPGAIYSTVRSSITGEDPNDLFQLADRSQQVGTGEWWAQKMDSTPLGSVTQPINPDLPGHQFAYNLSSNVPGALAGGRGGFVPTMVGATAGTAAAGMGADPATQVMASLAGGYGASRLMDSPMAPAKTREATEETPQQKLNRAASNQSMGAAGAAVDLQKLSPELREAVEKAVQQTGGAVNPEVLTRQIQADSLPVKVRLSQGQALGDERLISLELNARGKHEAYSKGFNEQNKALVENLRALRDETGPEVFSTNATEHADTLIGRYKAIDEAARADITAKYKALEDANGGQFPVEGKTFVDAADKALAAKMKTRYLPAELKGDLQDFRDNAGMMTFEQFENLRTNLAQAARDAERSGNGNAAGAIGIVRRELESLPMSEGNAQVKQLADAARSAAKARFDALDADPAYKAAVNDSVTPDAFVQKFVVNGGRDNVAKLAQAMSGDDTAAQTLKVATLEHLRKAAGIDPGYNGNFTQAGYNKALQALEPKLGSLLDPKTAETARTLGDVARYTQFQPRGAFANNSNTFVAAAAEKAADALEGVIDFKAGGIPIASTVRKQINENKARKAAEATFAPGAGLTKLSDLTKQGKKK